MEWWHHHLVHRLESFDQFSTNFLETLLNLVFWFRCWCKARMNWNYSTNAVGVDHSNNFQLMYVDQHMNRISCMPFWRPNPERLNAKMQLKDEWFSFQIFFNVFVLIVNHSLPNCPACGELSDMKFFTLWSS